MNKVTRPNKQTMERKKKRKRKPIVTAQTKPQTIDTGKTYQLLLHSRMLLFSCCQITLESILVRLSRLDFVLQCRSRVGSNSSHFVRGWRV